MEALCLTWLYTLFGSVIGTFCNRLWRHLYCPQEVCGNADTEQLLL